MNENWGSNVANDVVRHYPYQFTTYSVSDKRVNVNKMVPVCTPSNDTKNKTRIYLFILNQSKMSVWDGYGSNIYFCEPWRHGRITKTWIRLGFLLE